MVKLSSLHLQKIENEAEAIAAQHIARLNNISGVIKKVISDLKKAGMPFTYIYVLETLLVEETQYTTTCEEQCLVWGKGKNGNYQLMHNIYLSQSPSNRHDLHLRAIKLISSTPILGLKANVRLQLEAELATFYDLAFDSLKKHSLKSQVIVQSPRHFLPTQLSNFSVPIF
jgi:hypothetical protein